MRFTEFYPEKQGRPDTLVALDLDRHGPSIPYGYIKGAMLSASLSGAEESNNYTADRSTVILVSGGITITLPSAGINTGKYYYIKKVDANTSIVTVRGNTSGETIDGEEFITLNLQYSYVMVYCNGDVWYILGGSSVKIESLMESLVVTTEDNLERLVMELEKANLHLSSLSGETVDDSAISEEV